MSVELYRSYIDYIESNHDVDVRYQSLITSIEEKCFDNNNVNNNFIELFNKICNVTKRHNRSTNIIDKTIKLFVQYKEYIYNGIIQLEPYKSLYTAFKLSEEQREDIIHMYKDVKDLIYRIYTVACNKHYDICKEINTLRKFLQIGIYKNITTIYDNQIEEFENATLEEQINKFDSFIILDNEFEYNVLYNTIMKDGEYIYNCMLEDKEFKFKSILSDIDALYNIIIPIHKVLDHKLSWFNSFICDNITGILLHKIISNPIMLYHLINNNLININELNNEFSVDVITYECDYNVDYNEINKNKFNIEISLFTYLYPIFKNNKYFIDRFDINISKMLQHKSLSIFRRNLAVKYIENIEDKIEEYKNNITCDINKLLIGEDDSEICKLIREDRVEDFVIYVAENNFDINSYIVCCQYESNIDLLSPMFKLNHDIEFDHIPKYNLLQYTAFYGSIQIFKYLYNNNVTTKNNNTIMYLAIHGNNAELIHFITDNILKDNTEWNNMYLYAKACYHNEVSNYIEVNYIE